MDRYGALDLKWSLGYEGSQLHFITDDILVYACGNTLSFVSSTGKHIRSLQSEGNGVTALTVCPKVGFVAYAERTLNPHIFIINYPTCTLKCSLEGGAVLEYTYLSFSNDGKRLVSLSGVPDFVLTVWDCTIPTGTVIISNVSVGEGATEISINPMNWNQVILFGPSRLTLWNVEKCDTEKLLSPIEIKLPDNTAEVGTTTSPVLTPLNAASTNILIPPGIGSGGALFTPPNMSEVYYKESYEKFVKRKEKVKMESYCWTPKQTLYVGCSGGQLLSVEFDTGTATMLVNSCPPIEEETEKDGICINPHTAKRQRVTDDIATAHSLLEAGSVDCLVLSRRGLFIAGKNGLVQCFCTSGDMKLLDDVDISQPIKHLSWSPSYSKLAVVSNNGAILTVDPLQLPTSVSLLSNHLHTKLIGLDMLCPGSEHCVTCRTDGTVQVWSIDDGVLVSSINLDTECTCIACPLSCQLAVVGVHTGYLYFISLVDPTSPSLIEKKLMHSGPVTAIKHDQAGFFMMSASRDGPIFTYDSRPSSKFAVLGYIDLPGSTLDISLLTLGERNSTGHIQAAILTENTDGHTKITSFQLDNSILDNVSTDLYEDASKQFSSDFIKCCTAKINEEISTLTLVSDRRALSFLDSNFELVQFSLPQAEADEKEVMLDLRYRGHDLDGGKLALSFHKKWSASVASDGKVLLRLVDNPAATIFSIPHHYNNGGCQGITISRDCQSFITIGDTGSITCWKINYSDLGERKSWAAGEYFRNAMKSMNPLQTTENQILGSMPQFIPPADDEADKTWYMQAKEEARRAEDETYSESKAILRQEINNLREKVMNMITTNEELPEIEKLRRQEFILDTENYQRMLAEEEKLIAEVREDIELSNLATLFRREKIKGECWDNMAVKGKIIRTFQGHLEVSNYPMITRSEARLKELERVKLLRNIEMVERNIRKEVGLELERTLQPLKHHHMLDDEDLLGDLKEKHAKSLEEEGIGDPDALLGSHRGLYGGEERFLINQFHLHSQVYKQHQLVLLENCIYKIKTKFNEEFDQVMRSKVNEISRIKEKNVRISKIISQLKLNDALVQPSLSVDEEPERLLQVDDSEVKIEKYISPEETKRLKEAEKLEEEKRLSAKGDNARERALEMMMGGRLEVNLEEDLLKDLPRPEAMAKDPAEMSEEEIILVRDFLKKEEAFLEEREKLKKALEAELHKLQASIVQGMEQFDDRLQKLFQVKIKTQTAIHQDEMKILYLARSLFIEQEVVMRYKQLNDMLMKKKNIKVQLGAIISNAREKVDAVRDQYEILAAEDREFDRSFKRDFADCEPYVDSLYRLFRKRPRGQKLKPVGSSVEMLIGVGDSKTSQNMFAMRPGSGTSRDGDNLMVELDLPVHMPEGIEAHVWERFIAHRHKKVESENKVKSTALQLAEMSSFLQKRQIEESRVQLEIQNGFKDLNKLQEDKTVFDLNLEIQFLLKQGQVEVSMGNFIPDFSGSVLVHRNQIEELNSQIKTLGEAKLNSMLECKDFKRGIRMLEWEHRKMHMEAEDLVEKGREVQMMRVTKDLLQRLHEKDLFLKDIREKDTLEKTIEFNQKTLHKVLRNKSKTLRNISDQVKSRDTENKQLDQKVIGLRVSVTERARIENLAGVAPSEASRSKKMEDILTRRKLVEAIKMQDEEYTILKEEMERLRLRTFPALIPVD